MDTILLDNLSKTYPGGFAIQQESIQGQKGSTR